MYGCIDFAIKLLLTMVGFILFFMFLICLLNLNVTRFLSPIQERVKFIEKKKKRIRVGFSIHDHWSDVSLSSHEPHDDDNTGSIFEGNQRRHVSTSKTQGS